MNDHTLDLSQLFTHTLIWQTLFMQSLPNTNPDPSPDPNFSVLLIVYLNKIHCDFFWGQECTIWWMNCCEHYLHQTSFNQLNREGKVKVPSHLTDHIADTTATDRLLYNHPRCYAVPVSKSDQYKHLFIYSFLVVVVVVEAILDWNRLKEPVV